MFDPQELYELAERQHWQAHAIDLRRDREDWKALPRAYRERLIWHIASFFAGEERVMVELSSLLAAQESPGEAAFLATQQLDEARHAQHFDRFYEQVLGIDSSFDDRLEKARCELGPALVTLMDERLGNVSRQLASDPGDSTAKVDFVTLYHMIIEGMLAVTGQRMLFEFLERRDILPGWREGLRLIARDEYRHVAYGTWLLHEKAANPALRKRIAEQLDELIPLAADVLVPPGARPKWFRPLDWTGVEVYTFAFGALARRIKIVGIDLPADSAALVNAMKTASAPA
ncbi:MAG TPA: ribonucleotide-diphosphate reductase subunit beta [Solirubrobacteraceae bacterium]|jgi:ribonucleoside-diphosphate reductase beta chain|nr:ribonucleotide-diphosphate reductase subunit beta [Solirubrobacteraceae bacterium]